MADRFAASDYAFPAATAVWTLGWIAAAVAAGERVCRSADVGAIVAVMVPVLLGSIGVWVTQRMLSGRKSPGPQTPAKKEPASRMILGWVAAIAWSFAAVVWNIGVVGLLLQMAHAGRGWTVLFLVPWSVIGLFLMIVLFVGIGVVIDWVAGALRGE